MAVEVGGAIAANEVKVGRAVAPGEGMPVTAGASVFVAVASTGVFDTAKATTASVFRD